MMKRMRRRGERGEETSGVRFTWCDSVGGFQRGEWAVEVVNLDSIIPLTFNWSRVRGKRKKEKKQKTEVRREQDEPTC